MCERKKSFYYYQQPGLGIWPSPILACIFNRDVQLLKYLAFYPPFLGSVWVPMYQLFECRIPSAHLERNGLCSTTFSLLGANIYRTFGSSPTLTAILFFFSLFSVHPEFPECTKLYLFRTRWIQKQDCLFKSCCPYTSSRIYTYTGEKQKEMKRGE